MYERQERIASIIKQRKPLAAKISSVRESLMQAATKFDRFRTLSLETASGSEELSTMFGGLLRAMENSDGIISECNSLSGDLSKIQTRLSRDTLNIAVIGRARQGKSRLLQTITGLSTEEIPDGNLAFCTGVRSDIINEPSASEAYAQVSFLSEKRFISDNIAPYFQELQRYKPDLFTPVTILEFSSMTLPSPESFQASPEDSTQMKLHLVHLHDLQNHLPQYQDFLGRSPMTIKRDEIREYVAQDNEKGERVYFKHMAVDKVEIFCKFPNVDVGALRLIDLPGLGDTRIGDVERVVSALSDQVDLVFFLSKPSNAGAGWQDNEVHLYSQARRALGEKLPIERWSFWVFNHDSRPGAENMPQCEALRASMSNAQIGVADTVIADCTNPDEVSSLLIDTALDFLEKHIEANDREYAGNIQAMIDAVTGKMTGLLQGLQKYVREDSNNLGDSRRFDILFRKLWKDLRIGLNGSVDRDSDLRKRRDEPCAEFKARIESILTSEERGDLSEKLREYLRLERQTAGGAMTAYEGAMHRLRTSLSQKMQENLDDILDSVLNQMKDSICMILAEQGRLKNCFDVSDHTMLVKIREFITESGFANDIPTLMEGFTLLDTWRINYRSFIQHRLRSSLNRLDPLDRASMEYGKPDNDDEDDTINLLDSLYKESISSLRKTFSEIYPEPNKAAFAIAEEFKDLMIRSDGTEDSPLEVQWQEFYRALSGRVWPEEYGASQRLSEARTRLRTSLNSALQACESGDFDFAR